MASALMLVMPSMIRHGGSTRNVTAIDEEFRGLEVPSTHVSRAAAELVEQLDALRNRPMGEITDLFFDARCEKSRDDGAVKSCA